MASQGPGRKRTPNRNGVTPEEDALNLIAREAEARLTAKRAARAEAREIRMKELERQQKEIYQVQKKYYGLENLDNKWGDIEQWMEDSEQYTCHSQRHVSVSDNEEGTSVGSRSSLPENSNSSVANSLQKAASSSGVRDMYHMTTPDVPNGSSRVSTLSTDTLTSLGGASSRKGSGSSSVTADTEISLRDIKEIHELREQIHDVEIMYTQNLKEIKDSLSEMEMKYRKAMVSNAQLDNEKSNLIYEVDTLKDSLMYLEELLSETRHECEEKNKDLEREKHAHSILQFQFSEQKETLKQSEELLTEIRQLHVKQEGFIREISDLQETVKWKDKKIGALEKQKEFSDAIRNERDELRDEVVQLKDILKKHGIALGSELCTNGEVAVNESCGSACTELEHGSSLLGTQKLQLFSDENVGGSRRGQLQYPQEVDHRIEENHLPSSAPGSSFKSHMRAQYEDVGPGIYLNNSIEKIQNSVKKTQTVFEAKAEKPNVLEIMKGNVVPQPDANGQESTLNVKRSETGKEGNHDFTHTSTCEMSEKDIGQTFDETVVGDSQNKMVSHSPQLVKIDNTFNSQSASVSVKKKKKKRKKQKQKHSCDEKDVHSKMGENENQLIESCSIQTVVSECKSVHLEEATINEKVIDNVNIDEKIDLMHKGTESLVLQIPNAGSENILVPINNEIDCMSKSIQTVDSKTEIKIGNPTHDHSLETTTGDLSASFGKYGILSNSDDIELKDTVAFCADFSLSENVFEVKHKDKTGTNVVKVEAVDKSIHHSETDTQLGDTVDTAEVLEEKQEISTAAQLGDTVVTDEVHEEKQEISTAAQLGDTVVTAEVHEEKQEISTGMQLDHTVVTSEVLELKENSQAPMHMGQEFNIEKNEGEVKYEESFDLNMEVIKLEENLLEDNDCQKEHITPWSAKQICTTSEQPERADTRDEDQTLQIDKQNVLMKKDCVSVAQITTPGGNCKKYQRQSFLGYDEQGSKSNEEIIHFEHNEKDKQGASPENMVKVLDELLSETEVLDLVADGAIRQEAFQNMGEQEIRDVQEGLYERNKQDAMNGSKKESKKGKGKTKEDCKMS